MGAEFEQRLGAVFQSELLRPMLAAATEDPDRVRELMAQIRKKLDALDVALDEFAAPAGGQTAGVNGRVYGAAPSPASASSCEALDADEIGRNQRSRLREMVLLETLSSDARPFSLQQLMRALDERGFGDGSAAIVSQLHRMKKLVLIEQPANGMYEVTQGGLGHLRKLKASFGALERDRPGWK